MESETKTLFGIARPSGCYGGEEKTVERFIGFNENRDIATDLVENLSRYASDHYEVYLVKIEVLERVA